MLTVLAPAKINLTLEVTGKRPDGFHEIRSVIQTVSLCDALDFQMGQGISITSTSPGWLGPESLVSRAVSLVQEITGALQGAAIEVTKRIPLSSGLGGDSSDAAATLRGLNELWGLGLSPDKLLELAPRLGSDVAFFMRGGTAMVEGRGEVLTPLPPLSHVWVVLVWPSILRLTGKTARLYASLSPNHYTDGQITQRMASAIREGRRFTQARLFNTFENVAFDCFPGLKVYREHMLKLGVSNIHLAGSGPTLFTLLRDKARAEELYTRCRQQGMEAYLAETC